MEKRWVFFDEKEGIFIKIIGKTVYHASVVFQDQIYFFREDDRYGDKKCYWKLDLSEI